MVSAKEQVEQVLRELPDDCSIEDIQYHLFVIDKIRRRIEQADQGQFIPHDEVEKRLASSTATD